MGLGSISGALKKKGFSFRVLDADAVDLPIDELISNIISQRPRVIGISTYSSYGDIIKYIVKEIKSALKDSVVVLGGHHAFALKGKLLEETQADIVAIGEGEVIFSNICDAVLNNKYLEQVRGIYYRRSGEVFYTGDSGYIDNLDDIPLPAYEYFPMDRYQGHFYRRWTSGFRKPFGNIVTSRGCPFSCGFCSNVMWGKKVRFQSPERVILEIDYLVKHYGVRQLSFFDDTFTLDTVRVNKICDLIIDKNYNLDIYCSTRVDYLNENLIKKMARSGFKWIGIGIESGNERILRKISKYQSPQKCSEVIRMIANNRIAVYGSVILGYPEEDKSTLKDTLRFILNNPVHLPQFNIFVPYPGTPIYQELISKGFNLPENVNQFNSLVSYNKPISTKYLIFFLWYSYFRTFFNLRYLNTVRKTFKMRVFISDIIKLVLVMLRINYKKRGECCSP